MWHKTVYESFAARCLKKFPIYLYKYLFLTNLFLYIPIHICISSFVGKINVYDNNKFFFLLTV